MNPVTKTSAITNFPSSLTNLPKIPTLNVNGTTSGSTIVRNPDRERRADPNDSWRGTPKIGIDLFSEAKRTNGEFTLRANNVETEIAIQSGVLLVDNPEKINFLEGVTTLGPGAGANRPSLFGRARNDGVGLDDNSIFLFKVTRSGSKKTIEFRLPEQRESGRFGYELPKQPSLSFTTNGPVSLTKEGYLHFSGKTWTPNQLETALEQAGKKLGAPLTRGE
jgi:hypothetical protein